MFDKHTGDLAVLGLEGQGKRHFSPITHPQTQLVDNQTDIRKLYAKQYQDQAY